MAEKIPLNKFKRVTQSFLPTAEEIYRAPADRASVIINALTNSISNRTKTLTLSISAQNPSTNHILLSSYPIGRLEVINLAFEKLIIAEDDRLIISFDTPDASTFTTNSNAFWEIEEPVNDTTLENILFTAASPTIVTLVYNLDIDLETEVETPIFVIEGILGQTNLTLSILEMLNLRG